MSSHVVSLVKSESEASASAPSPQDMVYARKAHEIVLDALHKGSDVVQMPNGDLWVTEVRTVTYKYSWDDAQNRFERATGTKRKRRVAKERDVAAVPTRKVS